MTWQKPKAEIVEIESEGKDVVCASYHDVENPGKDVSDLDGGEW